MVLGVLDFVRRDELESPARGCANPRSGGQEKLVGRLVEVEGRLVLLVLVQIDGARGDDRREAQRDRDDDLEAGLPGARWGT